MSTATDSNGSYRLNGLLKGEQVLQVSVEGYHDARRNIYAEGSVEVNVALVRSVVIAIDLPGLYESAKPLDMVLIQPGTFTMGSPSDEQGRTAIYDWHPHEVTLTRAFYLGKYEVTQAQWRAVMRSNPSSSYGVGNDYPAHTVSWNDCQTFVENLNGMGLGTFRLPTEAEWEYACRAGTTTRYSFGDALECSADHREYCEILDEFMWWTGNNTYNGNANGAKAVGQKLPNPWGLYDIHGNVLEWCSDWWEDSSAGNPQVDPQGPTSGSKRVIRGGFWGYGPSHCRSAIRMGGSPDRGDGAYGLRLVREYP